jgi:cation transport ATPase
MIGKKHSVAGTPADVPLILTGLTVFGITLAIFRFSPLNDHASFVGILLVYFACRLPAAKRALTALWKECVLDIDLLMVVAAVAAAAVGAPFEGAVLLALFSLSTTLEERALGRARPAIEALMALRPETALRKSVDGTVAEVPAADLTVDDIVVLRPGARVPADRLIVNGYSSVDEVSITGESLPVAKDPGDLVFEATVNLDGVAEVVVTKTVAESTVARMISLVTQAQAAKAPSERFSAWCRSAVYRRSHVQRDFGIRRLLLARARLAPGALPLGHAPGGGESLRDRHFSSRCHFVGTFGRGAQRRAI